MPYKKKSRILENPKNCPLIYTINLISGKWKLPILWILMNNGVMRFNELKRNIAGITNMMLTQSLQEMQADGLVERAPYMEVSARVEYSLTETGKALIATFEEVTKWGVEQMKEKNIQCGISQ
jgi:DNA-binding HxlR family transcriptional regulator